MSSRRNRIHRQASYLDLGGSKSAAEADEGLGTTSRSKYQASEDVQQNHQSTRTLSRTQPPGAALKANAERKSHDASHNSSPTSETGSLSSGGAGPESEDASSEGAPLRSGSLSSVSIDDPDPPLEREAEHSGCTKLDVLLEEFDEKVALAVQELKEELNAQYE